MNRFCAHIRKGVWIGIILLIVLGGALASSVGAAPLKVGGGKLIPKGFHSKREQYCTGDEVKFEGFVVRDVVIGFFSSSVYNVPGATVKVNGVPKAPTNGDGMATWTETAGEPGDKQFEVTASAPGFADSDPATVTYRVMECTYDLVLQYDEKYTTTVGQGMYKTFAEVKLEGKLVPNKDRTLSTVPPGNSLKGTFVMKATLILGPNIIFCTPKNLSSNENVFTINITKATLGEDGTVTLALDQAEINMPPILSWDCTQDPSGKTPSWMNMAFPVINLIKRASLESVSFKNGEGNRPISIPGGAFWANHDITGNGSLTMTRTRPPGTLPPGWLP